MNANSFSHVGLEDRLGGGGTQNEAGSEVNIFFYFRFLGSCYNMSLDILNSKYRLMYELIFYDFYNGHNTKGFTVELYKLFCFLM